MTNKSKQELIDVAKRLEIGKEYESFYEFARSFLTRAMSDGEKETDSFFKLVRNIENQVRSNSNSIDSTTKAVLGKTGNMGHDKNNYKNNYKNNNKKSETSVNLDKLKSWCRSIENNNLNKGYTIDELNYIMGYAQRLSKIESLKAANGKSGNEYSVKKFNEKEEKQEKEKANSQPVSTIYRCSNCHEEVDIENIAPSGGFKTKCPACGKKHFFYPKDKV